MRQRSKRRVLHRANSPLAGSVHAALESPKSYARDHAPV
ncbi:protein of unknown function [Aminobacter niigataensis]|nr:protein of unknown function [Aminobacter niigataensis]